MGNRAKRKLTESSSTKKIPFGSGSDSFLHQSTQIQLFRSSAGARLIGGRPPAAVHRAVCTHIKWQINAKHFNIP